MIYKLHKFFREWEGYEKVYSFFKNNYSNILLIKACLYLLGIVFCFFNHSMLLSTLRVIVYLPLVIIEYFVANLEYEKGQKFSSFLSQILMFLNLVVVVLYSLNLIFGI